MDRDNLFLVVAIFALSLSLFTLVGTYNRFTGHATDTGTANLTVESSTAINFSTATIDWGSGKVDSGQSSATLDTEGTVYQGNWTAVYSGLVLENIGNTNVTLDLGTGKTADQFIGGTSPVYQWRISNNETGSCDGDEPLNVYATVNDTATSVGRFCTQFSYLLASNQVEIDINISIPQDSTKGALGDVITATATAA